MEKGSHLKPERPAKKRVNISHGCLNWQPILDPSGNAIEENMRFLKQEGHKSAREVSALLALQYIQGTYGVQRDY